MDIDNNDQFKTALEAEQEATIQKLKERIQYWANELEEYRNDLSNDNFEDRIAEMRNTADDL